MKPYERYLIRYARRQREEARRTRHRPHTFTLAEQLEWTMNPSKMPSSAELAKRFPGQMVIGAHTGTYGGHLPNPPLRRSWLTRVFSWLRPRRTPGAPL